MNKLAAAAAVVFAATAAWAVPGTIKTATDQKRGDIKWQRGSKSYALTYRHGQMTASMEFPLAQVEQLDIDKPANFDKLAAMVQNGQGGGAIAGLAAIVQEYRMLVWDKAAGRCLVEAYLSAGNPQKAYEVASGIIADDKSSAWTGDLAPAYWKALFKLGKTTQLENCLRKAAASGDRTSSAAALVMRGDIILANGADSPDSCRQALTDAYLRVALMYLDEPCRAVRADAMTKAAGCFDRIGMAARADSMRAAARTL